MAEIIGSRRRSSASSYLLAVEIDIVLAYLLAVEIDIGSSSSTPSSPCAIDSKRNARVFHVPSNPIARWHVCQGSINSITFSENGTYLATVGRDGYLRVFYYSKEQLVCGGKSYYGALLCCAWSSDGKYILTGGEDDLVQIWSMEDRKVVAWGEGHNSCVCALLLIRS